MMKQVALLAGLAAFVQLLVHVDAYAVCTNQIAQNNFNCHEQIHLLRDLPCGLTKDDHDQCYRIWTAANACHFALGDANTETFIDVHWARKRPLSNGVKPKPTENDCKAVEENVPPCSIQEEPDPGCPDPAVSGDDCDFPCGGYRTEKDGWNETCRAYALMPEGWRDDPWLPAEGFFTVGRTFPTEAISWMDGDEPYGATQALAEGRLGEMVLGSAGVSPLWGGEKGLISRGWRRLAKEVGVCVNEPGALLASPHWQTEEGVMSDGTARFPALVLCDGAKSARIGFDLYSKSADWDQKTWAESGAMAADVFPRLKRLAGHGFELVCVTADLADQRRQQRASKEPDK